MVSVPNLNGSTNTSSNYFQLTSNVANVANSPSLVNGNYHHLHAHHVHEQRLFMKPGSQAVTVASPQSSSPVNGNETAASSSAQHIQPDLMQAGGGMADFASAGYHVNYSGYNLTNGDIFKYYPTTGAASGGDLLTSSYVRKTIPSTSYFSPANQIVYGNNYPTVNTTGLSSCFNPGKDYYYDTNQSDCNPNPAPICQRSFVNGFEYATVQQSAHTQQHQLMQQHHQQQQQQQSMVKHETNYGSRTSNQVSTVSSSSASSSAAPSSASSLCSYDEYETHRSLSNNNNNNTNSDEKVNTSLMNIGVRLTDTAATIESNSNENRSFDEKPPVKKLFPNKPVSSNQKKTRTKDKYRVVYNELQRTELEKEYTFSKYITSKRKSELSGLLDLSQRQIKIWFQNRRAKDRKISKKKKHDSSSSSSYHSISQSGGGGGAGVSSFKCYQTTATPSSAPTLSSTSTITSETNSSAGLNNPCVLNMNNKTPTSLEAYSTSFPNSKYANANNRPEYLACSLSEQQQQQNNNQLAAATAAANQTSNKLISDQFKHAYENGPTLLTFNSLYPSFNNSTPSFPMNPNHL